MYDQDETLGLVLSVMDHFYFCCFPQPTLPMKRHLGTATGGSEQLHPHLTTTQHSCGASARSSSRLGNLFQLSSHGKEHACSKTAFTTPLPALRSQSNSPVIGFQAQETLCHLSAEFPSLTVRTLGGNDNSWCCSPSEVRR